MGIQEIIMLECALIAMLICLLTIPVLFIILVWKLFFSQPDLDEYEDVNLWERDDEQR